MNLFLFFIKFYNRKNITNILQILHIMLLSIAAIVTSYNYNKTTRIPITYTISKVIDLTKPSINETSESNRRSMSKSSKNPTNISKRQDPSFGSSLSTFDEPSGDIYSDSLSGFRDSKSSTKDAFDIDDIDIKSTPSFGFDDSRIKNSPSFNIVSPKIKESSSFDVDSPSFSLDGGNFNVDDTTFNTAFENEEETQDKEEEQQQEEEDPSFGIDPSDFEPTTKKPSSFESDFSSAKRSPPYSSNRNKAYSESSDIYGPQTSNSRSKSYDTNSNKYSKNPRQSYSKGSSSPTGPVYSDTNVQYVGSSATPINYVTTPHDRFDSPIVADNSKFPSSDQNFKGFSSFQNSLFDQGTFGQNSFQNLNGNSFEYSNQPVTQTPVYSTQYPGPKNSQHIYSPTSHQTLINLPSASPQSFDSLSTSLPTEIHNREFSGFIQGLESEPIVLNSGNSFNFQAPNFGIPFEFGTETGNQPFLTGHGLQQQRQVLPVQSSSSTPQFPQYKGASIQAHSRSDFANPPGGYQFLTNQPQLHFNPNNAPIDRAHVQIVHNPFERIRTDVEVINKKKPAPPQHDGKDDEDETEEDVEDNEELDDGW